MLKESRGCFSFFIKEEILQNGLFEVFLQNIHYTHTDLIYIIELETQEGKLVSRKRWASGNAVQLLKVTSKPVVHKALPLHYIISKGITVSSGRLIEVKFRRVSLALLLWASKYMAQHGAGKHAALQSSIKSAVQNTVQIVREGRGRSYQHVFTQGCTSQCSFEMENVFPSQIFQQRTARMKTRDVTDHSSSAASG